jgi:hypothetical protein
MNATVAKAAPGKIRRPAKRLLRRVGVATSRWRPLPDYLIIGAHRAGSTSLWAYLNQHPSVSVNFPRLQGVKGVRYFDENYFRGEDWYRSHFPTAAYRGYLRRRSGAPALAGDASTYYLFHPAAPERAAKTVPDAKIVALLRNPVDRAYSHWLRERRDGKEPLERFEEAVAAESGRLAGEIDRIIGDERYYSYAHENFSYMGQGHYLEPLRRWLEHFPRQGVHIEISERFSENPQAGYDRVLSFLGLPRIALRDTRPRNTIESTPIDPGLRRELTALMASENNRLEEFLGVEFGWNE